MSRPLRAGLFYAAIIFAIGFLLGAVRELVLRRHLGELPAVFLEIPIMLAASWLVARRLIEGLAIPAIAGIRLRMGLSAFGLLLFAEAGVGIFMMGQSVAQHLQGYFSVRGVLTLASQSVFALIPFLSLHARKPI